MKKRHGPTMRDVAALAGVAPITVSRALRDEHTVTPGTRTAILAAVQQLGYVPNFTASALSARGSRLVAMIVPNVANSVFASTIEGLTAVLSAEGYSLTIGYSGYSKDKEEQLVRSLLGYRPDAMILTGFTHTATTRMLLRRQQIPVVEIWNVGPEPIDMAVGFSNFRAAWQMTRYLIERGYRSIAYAGGTQTDNERTQAREEGYRMALAEVGLPVREDWIRSLPMELESGADLARQLWRSQARPRAYFIASDIIAAGFVLECSRLGIRVPDDVAVGGFDDTPLAAALNPPLTTIRLPQRRMGEVTGDLLLRRLKKKPIDQMVHDAGFEIVVRATT